MFRSSRILPAILVAILAAIAWPRSAASDYLAAEAALQANDFARAVPLFEEEAQLGNPVAAYNLGKIYATGAMGAPDYGLAAAWFRQAAEVGSRPARFDGRQLGVQAADLIFAAQLYSQFELAKLYEEGKGVPQDVTEAVRWYTRAADQDFDLAQLQLVRLYREGRGLELPADPAVATKWLTRLAERGNIAAMNDLGRAYLQGQGVIKNAKLAREWFEKASDLGSAIATFNLGLLYLAGYSGEPDYLRAAENFNLGANRKDAQSMAALGDLYFAGKGVPPSNLQAHVWYDLAVRYGLLIAAERRDNLAKSMSPADVSSARAMADSWRPQGTFGLALPSSLAPAIAPSAPRQPIVTAPEPQPAQPAAPGPIATEPIATEPVAPTTLPATIESADQPVLEPVAIPFEPSGEATIVAPAPVEGTNIEAAPLPAPDPFTEPIADPLLAPAPAPVSVIEPLAAPEVEPATAPATPEPASPLVGTPQPGAMPFEPSTN